jgi:hypothetical protein
MKSTACATHLEILPSLGALMAGQAPGGFITLRASFTGFSIVSAVIRKSKFTYSFAAAEAVVPHILGSYRGYLDTCTSWESIRENTKLFVCFGGVPLKNGQICQGGTGHHYQRENLIAAARADISFVNISPLKSDLLDQVGGEWLAPRPNTDTAILLGIAHTLHSEGLSNKAFLDTYTEGFEAFLPYLLGQTDGIAKTADWAAENQRNPCRDHTHSGQKNGCAAYDDLGQLVTDTARPRRTGILGSNHGRVDGRPNRTARRRFRLWL